MIPDSDLLLGLTVYFIRSADDEYMLPMTTLNTLSGANPLFQSSFAILSIICANQI